MKKKHATVKNSDAKRIKFARLHLRDCPARNFPNGQSCSGCNQAKRVFAHFGLEVEPRGDGGWYW